MAKRQLSRRQSWRIEKIQEERSVRAAKRESRALVIEQAYQLVERAVVQRLGHVPVAARAKLEQFVQVTQQLGTPAQA